MSMSLFFFAFRRSVLVREGQRVVGSGSRVSCSFCLVLENVWYEFDAKRRNGINFTSPHMWSDRGASAVMLKMRPELWSGFCSLNGNQTSHDCFCVDFKSSESTPDGNEAGDAI